jgi:hypothetical protein
MAYESDGNGGGQLRIPLPWMRQGQEVGAGDVIKRGTSAVGIRPCGGCQRRAAALNRRIVFVGRRRRR